MRMCPNDNSELRTTSYKGVRVDECEKCHGIFFDRGELNAAKNNVDPELRFLDFELFGVNTDEADKLDGDKKCPNCQVEMVGLIYKNSSVVVNKCPKCSGIWLDTREFDKIIAYLNSFVTSETSADLAGEAERELQEVLTHPDKKEELKDLMAVSKLMEMRYAAEHPGLERVLETYYTVTPFK